MAAPQIYKVIHFSHGLGSTEFVQGQAMYFTDKLSVARAMKEPNTRVFLYPQNLELTDVKVELS